MTEKDFRKLVTDLEFTKEDKEEVALFINNLETSLKENIKDLKIKNINKAGNLAATTIYHGSKTLELMVVFEKPLINSFPLMNQAAINAVWNFLVFNYNLDKVNLISINNQTT